jgi:hypothetical protein
MAGRENAAVCEQDVLDVAIAQCCNHRWASFSLEHGPNGHFKGNEMDKGYPEIPPVPRTCTRVRPAADGGQSNWVTAGWWLNRTGSPITCFRAQWKVPKRPPNDVDQWIFLFNGMQPSLDATQAILQPVLTWGFYGPSWTVGSFLYPDITGTSAPTRPVPVEPGDVVTGVIQLTAQGPAGFSYRCEFEGIPETVLTVNNIPELVYCAVALEATESGLGDPPYELNSPSDYPKAKRTRFRQIKIEAGAPITKLDWRTENYLEDLGTYFGEHASVVSHSATKGKIDIFYGE